MKFSISILMLFFGIFSSNSLFSQCPVDSVPAISAYSSGTDYSYNDYLDVDGTIISSSSGYQASGNSYQSFSNPVINLQQGNSYFFTLSGYSDDYYQMALWIDYNGDSIFSQYELAVLLSNEYNSTINFYVNIPYDAIADTVSMRLIKLFHADGWGYGNDDACNIVSTGEIEDYKVVINCAAYNFIDYNPNPVVCYSDSVELWASSNYGNISWFTDTNASPVFTGNDFFLNITPSTTDTIIYLQNSSGTCKGPFFQMIVTVNYTPPVNINSPDTVLSCSSYIFDATPGFGDYFWSNGDYGQTIAVNSGYGGYLSVNAFYYNGCTSTDQVWVSIATESPSNYAYVNPDTGFCYSPSFDLIYDSIISPGTCNWYLLPSNTFLGSGSLVQFIPSDTGVYNFVAYINSVCGIDTAYLTGYNYPPAYSSISPLNAGLDSTGVYNICLSGDYISLVFNGLNGSTATQWFGCDTIDWYWFNISSGDTIQIPVSMLTPGNVYAAFTYFNSSNGCQSSTDTILFRILNTLSINFPDTAWSCNFPTTYGFSAVDYSVYDILWNTGDTTNTITVPSPGYFSVTTYDSQTGCSNSDHVYINNGNSSSDVLMDFTTICESPTLFDLSYTGFNIDYWDEYDLSWNPMNQYYGQAIIYNQGFNEYLVANGTNNHGCSFADTTFLNFSGIFSIYLGPDVSTPQPTYTINGPQGYQYYSWSPGGENTSSITVNSSGTYTLFVDNGHGCSDTDAINVTFNTTSSSEEKLNTGILFYPNPVRDYLNISCEKDELIKVNLFDVNGKEVLSNDIARENNISIDVSMLKSGYYTTELITNNNKLHFKLVIVK